MSQVRSISQAHYGTTSKSVEHFRDTTGYKVFSSGSIGAAHVMAHQMLDDNRIELGHRLLGEWLAGRSGSGSEWIHLQFHMAVFELAVDDWDAAYNRYQGEILAAASASEDALTDAPALLWRLKLSAPNEVELSWDAVHRTALKCMWRSHDPFVELHNLLALAGAGDLANLNRWIQSQPQKGGTPRRRLVRRMAVALEAYATRQYLLATKILTNLIPQLKEVGGSRAQNQLFHQLLLSSRQLLSDNRLTA